MNRILKLTFILKLLLVCFCGNAQTVNKFSIREYDSLILFQKRSLGSLENRFTFERVPMELIHISILFLACPFKYLEGSSFPFYTNC